MHQNVNASSGNVVIGRETLKMLGTPDLIDQVGEVRLHIGPTSFLQVHHAQAERIYRLVRDWCGLKRDESALDVYCGVGGISLHLATTARQVMGQMQTSTTDWPQDALLNEGMRLLQEEKGLKAGTSYEVKIFRPDMMTAVPAQVQIGELKEIDLELEKSESEEGSATRLRLLPK